MDAAQTFIDTLDQKWQRETCQELLNIQRETESTMSVAIKWQNPYFSYNDQALLKWYCAKEWVKVYFFKGTQLDDKNHLFEKTYNKAMRTVKLFADSKLDKEAYKQLVKAAIELNG